jgi:hypothetical protein
MNIKEFKEKLDRLIEYALIRHLNNMLNQYHLGYLRALNDIKELIS